MRSELRRIQSELRKILVREENDHIRNWVHHEMTTNQYASEMDGCTNNEDLQQRNNRHESTSMIHDGQQIINGTRAIADHEVPGSTNPDIVTRKGRPKNMQKSRRMVSYGEMVRTKKQITCSTCGSHEHNKATCSKQPGEGEAVKKKTTAKKTANKHNNCNNTV
ncbi:hypothetical protein PVAP13_7KG252855 [Panicum virgatum]|uniref:Uncharacterized protein n=1 Tax=Panicum virgatum TaxID=38727 RepID=A0A8T0QID1_PANVG|nr:hypothetical protein PVAP13_7KG252855 [Panicum virgatum]